MKSRSGTFERSLVRRRPHALCSAPGATGDGNCRQSGSTAMALPSFAPDDDTPLPACTVSVEVANVTGIPSLSEYRAAWCAHNQTMENTS